MLEVKSVKKKKKKSKFLIDVYFHSLYKGLHWILIGVNHPPFKIVCPISDDIVRLYTWKIQFFLVGIIWSRYFLKQDMTKDTQLARHRAPGTKFHMQCFESVRVSGRADKVISFRETDLRLN